MSNKNQADQIKQAACYLPKGDCNLLHKTAKARLQALKLKPGKALEADWRNPPAEAPKTPVDNLVVWAGKVGRVRPPVDKRTGEKTEGPKYLDQDDVELLQAVVATLDYRFPKKK